VIGEGGRKTSRHVEPAELFEDVEVYWGDHEAVSSTRDLASMARAVGERLDRQERQGRPAPHGMMDELGISAQDVRATLRFVSDIAREDRGESYQRLSDPEWIAAHFRVLRWHSDLEGARQHRVRLADGQIRLTRYLAYRFPGSRQPTTEFDTALYSLPSDETGLSSAAAGSTVGLIRTLLTRKQVLDGAFEDGGGHEGSAEPLVYLKREHVHEALLQGTVQVALKDGSRRTFSVHRSNGRSFRHGRSGEDQDRFWYFRESESDGQGGVNNGIALRPFVAVAGDVNNLGYGGLYALEDEDGLLRLVVLADTGGAFQPNMYQFDLFTGTHESREALNAATAHIPARPAAYMLVLRHTNEVP
jgi:hypothetical protein